MGFRHLFKRFGRSDLQQTILLKNCFNKIRKLLKQIRIARDSFNNWKNLGDKSALFEGVVEAIWDIVWLLQHGLIISTFHGSYTVSKEHDRATAVGNHEPSDEIMPATKLPHRFSGEAAVPVNNTVYNTCVYYLFIAPVRSNYGLPIT